MTALPVSVVVVSRDRPDALMRCLKAVRQLRYPAFEVVVVTDPAGISAASGLPFSDLMKVVPFDRSNISEARNLGVSHAAGDVVAFIDDDAVPEPSWLSFLVAPFAQESVAATGGYVRGRNGISYQWKARSVDHFGRTEPLELEAAGATVLKPKGQRAIKTEGTNMAVRRDVLVELEGFDPGFAFFLDETDLNLRLAQAGYSTALVPMAEVHHGYSASPRRRADRVPRDLFDIGASWAVFQRKYVKESDRVFHWRGLRADERKRLIRHMVSGLLQPGDVRRLLVRLDQGYAQGKDRKRGGAQVSRSPMAPFQTMPVLTGESVVLRGRIWQKAHLMGMAKEQVHAGKIVSLILLSPTSAFHTVRFADDGYWEQRGGLFGRSERHEPVFRPQSFTTRVDREVRRVAKQRLINS